MIILNVTAGGLEVVKAFFVGFLISLVEQIELKFRSKHAGIATFAQALDLLFQDRPRAVRQVPSMVMIEPGTV